MGNWEVLVKLFEERRFDEVIKKCTKLIDDGSDQSEIFHLRGTAYRLINNYQEALLDFNVAIELNPHFDPFFHGRSLLFSELGEYEKAFKDITTALEIKFKLEYEYTRIDILINLNDYTNAKMLCDNIINSEGVYEKDREYTMLKLKYIEYLIKFSQITGINEFKKEFIDFLNAMDTIQVNFESDYAEKYENPFKNIIFTNIVDYVMYITIKDTDNSKNYIFKKNEYSWDELKYFFFCTCFN